jgi:hypothetical protein
MPDVILDCLHCAVDRSLRSSLDCGIFDELRRDGDQPTTPYTRNSAPSFLPSKRLVAKIVRARKTMAQTPKAAAT